MVTAVLKYIIAAREKKNQLDSLVVIIKTTWIAKDKLCQCHFFSPGWKNLALQSVSTQHSIGRKELYVEYILKPTYLLPFRVLDFHVQGVSFALKGSP